MTDIIMNFVGLVKIQAPLLISSLKYTEIVIPKKNVFLRPMMRKGSWKYECPKEKITNQSISTSDSPLLQRTCFK